MSTTDPQYVLPTVVLPEGTVDKGTYAPEDAAAVDAAINHLADAVVAALARRAPPPPDVRASIVAHLEYLCYPTLVAQAAGEGKMTSNSPSFTLTERRRHNDALTREFLRAYREQMARDST